VAPAPAAAHQQLGGYEQPAAYDTPSYDPPTAFGQSGAHGQSAEELRPAEQAAEPRAEPPPASPHADMPWSEPLPALGGAHDAWQPAGQDTRRSQEGQSQIQPAPNGTSNGGVSSGASKRPAGAVAAAGQKAKRPDGQQAQQKLETKAKQCCGCCVM